MRALRPGAMTVFISVWPVLKSLPEIGTPFSLRELQRAPGMSTREVRRAVAEGHALHDRGVGVEHGRRDRLVVVLHRLLELLERRVLRARLDEDLGRRAPHDDDAVAAVLRLKSRMSCRSCSARSRLVLPFLTFGAVDARDVLVLEHGRHRLDRSRVGP